MKAGMRAIFNSYGGPELIDRAIYTYNNMGIPLPYCNSTLGAQELEFAFDNVFALFPNSQRFDFGAMQLLYDFET